MKKILQYLSKVFFKDTCTSISPIVIKYDDIEYERKYNIIYNYLVELEASLNNLTYNNILFSWTNDIDTHDMMSISIDKLDMTIRKDVNKYVGKRLAMFIITLHHKTHTKKIPLNNDIWITCEIHIYEVNKKEEIDIDKSTITLVNKVIWIWQTDDFKITKLDLKFLKFLMYIVNKELINFETINQISISEIFKEFNGIEYIYDDILYPLEGLVRYPTRRISILIKKVSKKIWSKYITKNTCEYINDQHIIY